MNTTFLNAFSKKAQASNATRAEEVAIMKGGIAEILWISIKEEQKDYDSYIVAINELMKSLMDGYAVGYYRQDGSPLENWKSTNEQHAVLSTALAGIKKHMGDDLRWDLSLEGLNKLKERREERKARRTLSSGTQNEREQFEGVSEAQQKEYARYANEKAIAEMETKRTKLKAV